MQTTQLVDDVSPRSRTGTATPEPPRVTLPPPGPRGYPLVGSMPRFARDPLGFLLGASRRYGDVVDLGPMGRHRSYLVAHPDHVKYVLQENARNYEKGENFKAIKLIIGEGLVVSEGEHWRRQRRLMQPAFHRQRIGALVDVMVRVIDEAVGELPPPGAPFDMSREMMKITQRVLLKALLGVDAKEAAELGETWDVLYDFLSARLWAIVKIPLGVPTATNRRFAKAMSKLDALVYRIIQERRTKGGEASDLLSLLLASQDADTGDGMSDRELRDEIMTMFAGGFETSAVVLSWAFYLLAQSPGAEAKLHAELERVLGGRAPAFADIPALKYTKMVLDETMRIYPGAWIFTRSNLEADVIGGYAIAPRAILFISPYVTHRHPDFWPDPEVFDPERFADNGAAKRPRFAFFPFGGGARQCLGDVFATTEMTLALAMIAQRFRARVAPSYRVIPEPMFTLRAKHGLAMTLERASSTLA